MQDICCIHLAETFFYNCIKPLRGFIKIRKIIYRVDFYSILNLFTRLFKSSDWDDSSSELAASSSEPLATL